MAREHGTGTPTASATFDRGNHVIQGLANAGKESFDDETERNAFVCLTSDIGRVAYQAGGGAPGLYICTAAGAGPLVWRGPWHDQIHALGGADHGPADLAELNALLNDATLDDAGAARPPTSHTHGGADLDIPWRDTVVTARLVGNATIAALDALTGVLVGDAYVVADAGTPAAGTSDALVAGDIAEYSGESWFKIADAAGGFPPDTTRCALSTETALIAPYTAGADDGKLVAFDGSSLTGADTAENLEGTSVAVEGSTMAQGQLLSFTGTEWQKKAGGPVTPLFVSAISPGTVLQPGSHNLVTGLSADGELLLPPSPPKGTEVSLQVFGQATELKVSTTDGSMFSSAQSQFSDSSWTAWGSWSRVTFRFIGDKLPVLGGLAVWEVQHQQEDPAGIIKTVRRAQLGGTPLAFSTVGDTLVSTTNGELIIDGAPASGFGSELADQMLFDATSLPGTGRARRMRILDPGSAGTPWVLGPVPDSTLVEGAEPELIYVRDGSYAGTVIDNTRVPFDGGQGLSRTKRTLQTADATTTTLYTIDTDHYSNLDSVIVGRGTICARRAGPPTTGTAVWHFTIVIDRAAPVVVAQFVFSPTPYKQGSLGAIGDPTALVESEKVRIQVAGLAGETVGWGIDLDTPMLQSAPGA